MNPIVSLRRLISESSFSPEQKEQVNGLLQCLQVDAERKDFMIARLQENRTFTENFLDKTVKELEEKNQELECIVQERKRDNKQLITTNQELEEFAYIISHDLQEPLRTILSFVSLLERKKGDSLDEKTQIYLTFISQSSRRLSNLIKAILDYSRIGKIGKETLIDCSKVVNEVLFDLSTAIHEKKASITIDILPVVFGFRDELHSLFQNLISNALKYAKESSGPVIHISCIAKGPDWHFSISDNGIGFDPLYKDRIFVIFQRLHNPNNTIGSGIGLSRCKKIVELHEGKIWAESTPDIGSTFHFTIPQYEVHEKV